MSKVKIKKRKILRNGHYTNYSIMQIQIEESSGGTHLQVQDDMNELVLLDWNTPRNLDKGKSIIFPSLTPVVK